MGENLPKIHPHFGVHMLPHSCGNAANHGTKDVHPHVLQTDGHFLVGAAIEGVIIVLNDQLLE